MIFPNKNIVCIGEILWDVFAEIRKPGGAPLNVAMHLKQLGNSVNIVSKVGNDKNGIQLIDIIRKAGLDSNYIQNDATFQTGEVLVNLDSKGNASYEIKEPVAWDNLDFSPDLKTLSENAGIIVYGTLASRNRASRNAIIQALNNNAVKIIDVNLRPPYTDISLIKELLLLADFAKLNTEELHIIAGWDNKKASDETELMKWLAQRYNLSTVCVTRGENGAILYDSDSIFRHSGFRVKVADTVGAGDAFLAGLISSLLKGNSADDSLEFACATGAFVASRVGATPEYNRENITTIITNR
jgi:fructokinase